MGFGEFNNNNKSGVVVSVHKNIEMIMVEYFFRVVENKKYFKQCKTKGGYQKTTRVDF